MKGADTCRPRKSQDCFVLQTQIRLEDTAIKNRFSLVKLQGHVFRQQHCKLISSFLTTLGRVVQRCGVAQPGYGVSIGRHVLSQQPGLIAPL